MGRFLQLFRDFASSGSFGGFLLLGCVVLALAITNSPLGPGFESLLATRIGYAGPILDLKYSVLHWVNDGLMAVFFLLVGLEIKRELVEGELASLKQAALPLLAALGGVVTPAAIYSLLNMVTDTANGWGIPMATDIAFALAVVTLLGSRVPAWLKVFLTALAIVDDLCAIAVIALFYSSEIHLDYLGYSAGLVALQWLFNRFGFRNLLWYLVPGVLMWYCIHHSGIHATIAGVLTAMAIPCTPNDTSRASPLETLEHALLGPVNYGIMPLFALVNTTIVFDWHSVDALGSPMGLGIIMGLLVGKPLGITLFCLGSVRLGLAALPQGARWVHIIGAGCLAGIGFTMSIFIALLAFPDQGATDMQAKLAILFASVMSGVVGYLVLRRVDGEASRH